MTPNVITQINWQRQMGGGEVYTRFFTRALQSLGWKVNVVIDQRAAFWREMGMNGVNFIPIENGFDVPDVMPKETSLIVSHMNLPVDISQHLSLRHRLACIVHMPLYERKPGGLVNCHLVLPVSSYVRESALFHGLQRVHEEPLLGIADLNARAGSSVVIRKNSEFDWDLRKFRDRAFSLADPLRRFLPQKIFSRNERLTLGIVSRLTPIKQFPALFALLAPVLAEFPEVCLEIFGSGGYASVRDLRAALAPLGERVRWWGHQSDPAAIYPQLDYLLSGLPEREALGLNLIEAQVAGTPVLAVNAPPFVETVADGASGFLYTDPRQDGGASFRALIASLLAGRPRPDPRVATKHLERFSAPAFEQRVARAMASLAVPA